MIDGRNNLGRNGFKILLDSTGCTSNNVPQNRI